MPGEEERSQIFEGEDCRLRHSTNRERSSPAFEEARVHNERAKKFYESNQLEKAETEVRQALILAPDWSALHDNLGTICSEQGKYGEALIHYAQALKLDPESPTVLYNLGYFLLQNGLEVAHSFLEKTLERDANYPDAHRALGEVFMERGENRKAIASFVRAIEQNPADTRTRFRLSDMFWEQGDYHESAQQLYAITKIDPTDAVAWHNLALTALILDDRERAEKNLLHALELDPDYVLAHYHLACYYAEGYRTEEALHHLNIAATLERENVREWALDDNKLDHLRHNPRFEQIIEIGD
ncbi:MAG: tetratricopeptide repeat protein [Chloroflexota bacterium]|nr:tetratricopeptide repeat protein [Chloroflexota bacterium]